MKRSLWCFCFLVFCAKCTIGLKLEHLFDLTKKNATVVNTVELLIPTLNSDNQRCREHSQYYLQQLKNFRLWATEMFDATAKFPSGVLHGSIYSMGNFDQCVEVKVPYRSERFSGKYCMAKFTVKPPDYLDLNQDIDYVHDDYEGYFNISTWEKITTFSQDESKGSRNDIYFSYCLPSSCTDEDLEISLEKLVNHYNSIFDFEVTVNVDKRSCQITETLRFTTADIAYMTVLAIFTVTVIFASVYHLTIKMDGMDNYRVSRKFHNIIMCFSFPHNLKKLASKSKNEDGLNCISGLKTLSMFFVIMGHRCMFTLGAPMTNPKFIEEMYTRVEATVFLNGPIIVDTFFVISGFLATYMTIHFFEKHRFNAKVLRIYLHRIIRMVPAYAIVLAFYCTLFVKIGSGPFWQERVGLEQERCLQSWWTNLLHINNYVNVDKLCMFQSWYLTCDMHYFLVMPLFVWLLRKTPTIGILTIAGLILLSLLTTFVTVYINNEHGILLLYIKLLKDPVLNKTFRNIYTPSHLRASPYFVGIITAYIKYKMKTTGYMMPKHILYVGWITCVSVVSLTVYSAFIFYLPGYIYDTVFSAFYASLHHFTFSLCMSWIIIAVSSGNGAWIEPILSWKPFLLLSRITYTSFLTHGVVQIMTSAMMRVPRYVGVFNIIYDTCGDTIFAFITGFILTIYFEAPIIGLEKVIFTKDDRTYMSKADARSNTSGSVVINIKLKQLDNV